MYTWQLENWPNFTCDTATAEYWTNQTLQAANRIFGALDVLPEALETDAQIDLMVSAAIETSAIEGERLNREDVRSSIKNHFLKASDRIPVHDPAAAGISSLILEVRDRYRERLTEELLHHWHRLVLPQGLGTDWRGRAPLIGQWRTHQEPMQIVSGTIDNPTVHFEAPSSRRVPAEMDQFLAWFNGESQGLPGIARAAIAHLWFETIHPYEDGNGRIGRAIADMAISQCLDHPVLMSVATVFSGKRKDYYAHLNEASKDSLDVDKWVDWFGRCAVETQINAMGMVQRTVSKARFWERLEQLDLNKRQLKVVRKMLDAESGDFEGGMNATKYKGIARCAKATATRDLQDLVEKEVLSPVHAKGRYARYELQNSI